MFQSIIKANILNANWTQIVICIDLLVIFTSSLWAAYIQRQTKYLSWRHLSKAFSVILGGFYYLSTFFHTESKHADAAVLAMVFALTVVMLFDNPFWAAKHEKEIKMGRHLVAIRDAINSQAAFPEVVLKWIDRGQYEIIEISRSMIDFLIKLELTKSTERSFYVGKNWADIFPHKSEWHDINQRVVHGAEHITRQVAEWQLKPSSPKYIFSYSIIPLISEVLQGEKLFLAQFFDAKDFYLENEKLRKELEIVNADKLRLVKENHQLDEFAEKIKSEQLKGIKGIDAKITENLEILQNEI